MSTGRHTTDWQSKSEYEPEVIIGNADTGYGDDGTQVRYTPICEVADSKDFAGNLALILATEKMLAALKIAEAFISDELETRKRSFLPDATEDENGYLGAAQSALDAVSAAIAKAGR